MSAKCWYWKQGIPQDVCNLILAEATDARFSRAETREESGDEYRNNNIFFLDKQKNVSRILAYRNLTTFVWFLNQR